MYYKRKMIERDKKMVLKTITYSFIIFLVLAQSLFICGCRDRESDKIITGKNESIPSAETFLTEVKVGNRDKVEMLIKDGVDIEVKDKDGYTALLIAAEMGNIEMVKVLLENGADVNARDIDKHTALIYAAYQGNLEIAEMLLKYGADVHAKDKDGWTALMFASIQQKDALVKLLKKYGAGSKKK